MRLRRLSPRLGRIRVLKIRDHRPIGTTANAADRKAALPLRHGMEIDLVPEEVDLIAADLARRVTETSAAPQAVTSEPVITARMPAAPETVASKIADRKGEGSSGTVLKGLVTANIVTVVRIAVRTVRDLVPVDRTVILENIEVVISVRRVAREAPADTNSSIGKTTIAGHVAEDSEVMQVAVPAAMTLNIADQVAANSGLVAVDMTNGGSKTEDSGDIATSSAVPGVASLAATQVAVTTRIGGQVGAGLAGAMESLLIGGTVATNSPTENITIAVTTLVRVTVIENLNITSDLDIVVPITITSETTVARTARSSLITMDEVPADLGLNIAEMGVTTVVARNVMPGCLMRQDPASTPNTATTDTAAPIIARQWTGVRKDAVPMASLVRVAPVLVARVRLAQDSADHFRQFACSKPPTPTMMAS